MDPVTVSLRKIGNSLGIILSQRAAQMLGAKEGDELVLTESPDGLRITPYDPGFERKMKIAGSIMSRYKNALRELAK